jgi:hypothetical protein
MPIYGTCKKCRAETIDYCCGNCMSEEIVELSAVLYECRQRIHSDICGSTCCGECKKAKQLLGPKPNPAPVAGER